MKIHRVLTIALIALFSSVSLAQIEAATTKSEIPKDVKSAPSSFVVQYQGGIFEYSKKEIGTLKFDDLNERLVFVGAGHKERFGIPYKAFLAVYGDSRRATSTPDRW